MKWMHKALLFMALFLFFSSQYCAFFDRRNSDDLHLLNHFYNREKGPATLQQLAVMTLILNDRYKDVERYLEDKRIAEYAQEKENFKLKPAPDILRSFLNELSPHLDKEGLKSLQKKDAYKSKWVPRTGHGMMGVVIPELNLGMTQTSIATEDLSTFNEHEGYVPKDEPYLFNTRLEPDGYYYLEIWDEKKQWQVLSVKCLSKEHCKEFWHWPAKAFVSSYDPSLPYCNRLFKANGPDATIWCINLEEVDELCSVKKSCDTAKWGLEFLIAAKEQLKPKEPFICIKGAKRSHEKDE